VEPTAKSLILDLLSAAGDYPMPVRAVVQTGGLFGLSANSLRVALARLRARGLVESDDRGLYRLAPGARVVQQHVGAWSQLEERMVPWGGGWIAVHTAGLSAARRSQLRQRSRALEFFGFRMLAPELRVRPDNLKGGVEELRPRLYALGLDGDAPVFVMQRLDPETERRARGLWDVKALCRSYREARQVLQRAAERLPDLPPERALVETFAVGGPILRQLAFDPLLPEPIVPAEPRQALVDEMRRYDRMGRPHWHRFMKAQGVPPIESPLRGHLIDLGRSPRTATGSSP
jgi:phenylacetic acid degradation operon negative regulatory protein